jgi:hypothetical protein
MKKKKAAVIIFKKVKPEKDTVRKYTVADPGYLSWILIFIHSGSQISDPRSKISVLGSPIQDLGSRIPDPRSRFLDPRSKISVLGSNIRNKKRRRNKNVVLPFCGQKFTKF